MPLLPFFAIAMGAYIVGRATEIAIEEYKQEQALKRAKEEALISALRVRNNTVVSDQ